MGINCVLLAISKLDLYANYMLYRILECLAKLSIITIQNFLFISLTKQLQVEISIELFMKSYNLLIVELFWRMLEKKERHSNI